MFNPIIDAPPTYAEIKGRRLAINTDFKYMLDYLRLSADENETEEDKILCGLDLMFEKGWNRDDMQEMQDFLNWYANCGEVVEEKEKKKASSEPKSFDILIDSGRIYAAFLQVYGISLRKAKMHWWIFMTLLEGLPSGTRLSEVCELRLRKETKSMSAEDKVKLAKAQERYSLNKRETVSKRVASIMRGML